MFGIGGDPWQTPLSETKELAAWEPSDGTKGGMMEFNIDDDTDYQAADAIIQILGTLRSPAAASESAEASERARRCGSTTTSARTARGRRSRGIRWRARLSWSSRPSPSTADPISAG